MPESDDFTALILGEMQRPDYRPRRCKELARDLGIRKPDYHGFRDCLKDLAGAGAVVRRQGGRWALPEAERLVTGIVDIARSGYGFVLPDNADGDDLFVPEQYLGGALNGDRVKVRVETRPGRDYRRFAKVVEVLERGAPRIVALVLAGATAATGGKARPEDPMNPHDYLLTPGGPAVWPGEKVLLEITTWPGEGKPEGKVLDVLGPAGEPDTETAAILASFAAPGPFPDQVKAEVRQLKRRLSPAQRQERLDLTDLVTFTIDPETARDFDDALSYEEREDGSCVVGVHIADVSHFAPPGSRLDEEARERSTSIYLPARVIPMLPEELSNDLCSLRPEEEHPTKTVFLRYDPAGKRLNYQLHRSLIRSRKRFTYAEVKTLLENKKAENSPGKDVMESLRGLHRLAQKLRARRLEQGGIELHLPEFQVVMDDAGLAVEMVEIEHDFSHQLVEEFMLAANVALAEWCTANGLPVLHRAHAPPADDDVEDLAAFLIASGYAFKRPFQREHLNAVIARARGRPEEHAINLAILKSFKQAVYSADSQVGHFALNFPRYLHFTSPIRRYPDLHLHQALDRAFAPGRNQLPKKIRRARPPGGKDLARLGEHTSKRERRAMKIEAEVKDFRRLELLSRHEEREFTAVVTGIRKFGIFVEIGAYFVEGMIPRAQLEKKGFSTREEAPGSLYRRQRQLAGGIRRQPGFHLGQEVRVRVTRIDLPARLCELEFLKVV